MIDFSNSISSKECFLNILNSFFRLFLLVLCLMAIHYMLFDYDNNIGFEIGAYFQRTMPLLTISILAFVIMIIPSILSQYRNRYEIQNEQLHVKEYYYFFTILDTNIPLDSITHSQIVSKKAIIYPWDKKLELSIGDKKYKLYALNHINELNQYIQQFISNK